MTWDTRGANNIRNVMTPVQSPYYLMLQNPSGQPILWYLKQKGSRTGNWAGDFFRERVKFSNVVSAKKAMTKLGTDPDLKRTLKNLGYTTGEFKLYLVSYRDNEKSHSFPLHL